MYPNGKDKAAKERLTRESFNLCRARKKKNKESPYPPALPTRFVRASSRQLQGEQTRVVLPSHPVLQVTMPPWWSKYGANPTAEYC